MSSTINDQEYNTVEAAYFSEELRDAINKMLNTLTPKEEKVLRMRFGIGCSKNCTVKETVEEILKEGYWGVTQSKIRQIERRALRKLKHPSRLKVLKEFA